MPPKLKAKDDGSGDSEKLTRIAVISSDRCKPKKCKQECKKSCPVVKIGKLCIEVSPASKIAFLSEELCIGCGICVKARVPELHVWCQHPSRGCNKAPGCS
jgi:ATP-binding cassette subfamily E protein 1